MRERAEHNYSRTDLRRRERFMTATGLLVLARGFLPLVAGADTDQHEGFYLDRHGHRRGLAQLAPSQPVPQRQVRVRGCSSGDLNIVEEG